MVNGSLYVFGKIGNRPFQFPNDYTSDFFKKYMSACKEKSMLTIYQNEKLVYYFYIKRLRSVPPSDIFGLCFVFNGTQISDLSILYKAFDKIFYRLILSGNIFNVSKDGDISFRQQFAGVSSFLYERIKITAFEMLFGECKTKMVYFTQNFSGLRREQNYMLYHTSPLVISDSVKNFQVVNLQITHEDEISLHSTDKEIQKTKERSRYSTLERLAYGISDLTFAKYAGGFLLLSTFLALLSKHLDALFLPLIMGMGFLFIYGYKRYSQYLIESYNRRPYFNLKPGSGKHVFLFTFNGIGTVFSGHYRELEIDGYKTYVTYYAFAFLVPIIFFRCYRVIEEVEGQYNIIGREKFSFREFIDMIWRVFCWLALFGIIFAFFGLIMSLLN